MRKCSSMLALAAFLLSAAPALAQSSDAMAAARDLMVTMRTADTFKAVMPAIIRNLKPAIVQERPNIERDYDAIMPILLEGMSARLNEVLDQLAALYARIFTAEELREINAFYTAPTGQKFVQKQAPIMQESMAIGQKFGESVAREMQSRMIDELRKRGHKL
jgi:uncharacterized protein